MPIIPANEAEDNNETISLDNYYSVDSISATSIDSGLRSFEAQQEAIIRAASRGMQNSHQLAYSSWKPNSKQYKHSDKFKTKKEMTTQINFEDIVETIQYPANVVLPPDIQKELDLIIKYVYFGKPLPITLSERDDIFGNLKYFGIQYMGGETEGQSRIVYVRFLSEFDKNGGRNLLNVRNERDIYYKCLSIKEKALVYYILKTTGQGAGEELTWVNDSISPLQTCDFSMGRLEVFGEVIKNVFLRHGLSGFQRWVCPNSPHSVKFNPDDLTMSYINKNRRVVMKPGRLLVKFGKMYDIDYQDSDKIKRLQMELTICTDDRYKFEIVTGNDILKYYHHSKIADVQTNSLSNSCMKHDKCTNYLKMYLDIPDIKMLILRDDIEDKIIGRALLFNSTTGEKVMDRIYGTEKTYLRYKNWAIKSGYWRKERQTHDNQMSWVSPEGKPHVKKFSIKCDVRNYTQWPYLDSFLYALDDGTLTNRLLNDDSDKYIGKLRSIDGGIKDRRF